MKRGSRFEWCGHHASRKHLHGLMLLGWNERSVALHTQLRMAGCYNVWVPYNAVNGPWLSSLLSRTYASDQEFLAFRRRNAVQPLLAVFLACPQGVKRTKLGLREFVKLGDFIQDIDPATGLAVRQLFHTHTQMFAG